MALKHVAKRVSYDLDTTFATDTVVLAFEHFGDVGFANDAKTLGYNPAKWVPTAQRTNGCLVLGKSYADTPS